MKSLILTICLLMVSAAQAKLVPYSTREEAFKAIPVCTGPVTADETRVARMGGDGRISVTPLGNESDFVLMTNLEPIDLKIQGDVLFALSDYSIQEWGLTAKALLSQTKSWESDIIPHLGNTAMGMAFHGTDLIIAHGGMGYSIYDTTTHKLKDSVEVMRDQLPRESKLTSVVVVGDQAIFSVDQWTLSETKPAFFGFLVVDLLTGKEVRRVQGPDIGSESMVRNGEQLIVGYGMGPLHVFLLKDVLTGKRAPIRNIVTKYNQAGMPVGQPVIADGKMLTCFAMDPVQGQPPQRPRKVPFVLDLGVFTIGR